MSKKPTAEQNAAYLACIMPDQSGLLDDTLLWIEANLEPDDIWDADYLCEHVRLNRPGA